MFTNQQIQSLQKLNSNRQFQIELNQILSANQPIVNLIKNSYSYATLHNYTCQQKCQLVNLLIQLIKQIPILQTKKIDYIRQLEEKVMNLSIRKVNHLEVNFTYNQSLQLLQYIQQQLLPFYQFYETVLNNNEHFELHSTLYDPIPTVIQSAIVKGNVVDVDNIELLKQFIGIRQPKQTKTQQKKK